MSTYDEQSGATPPQTGGSPQAQPGADEAQTARFSAPGAAGSGGTAQWGAAGSSSADWAGSPDSRFAPPATGSSDSRYAPPSADSTYGTDTSTSPYTSAPRVPAGYSLTPDNYVDGQYRAASSRQQLQMYMRVQNLGRASAQATTPFGEFNMNTAVSTDENSVSVGGMLHVLSWTPEKRANGTFSRAGVPGVTVQPGDSRIAFHQSNLYAPIGFAARKDQLVPYGSMIQQWSAENTYVQLWLLKNGSSSQPQLCWNFWLPKLKRTYCQAWQVPAGWIAGSVLQNGGNFVNDNREPQGGSGNLYWQQLSAAQ